MIAIADLQTTRETGLARGVGFLCLLSAPLWAYGLFFPFGVGEGWGIEDKPLAILPVLGLVLALQLALIYWTSAGDRFLAEVMFVGFLFKLAAASIFMFTVTQVYQGTADLFLYFEQAREIVANFSLTGSWTVLHPIYGTNFTIMQTSWLVFVFGPTFQGLMIVSAALSFWGQYLFYRSFCIAFPRGLHRPAALVMFLLPSVVFWTSSIGKDSVTFFFIGASCYWFSKLTQRNNPAAIIAILASLLGVMLVRPHIAGMLVISLAAAYLLSKNLHGTLGMAAKTVGIPLLLLASTYFVTQAQNFVDEGGTQQTAQGLLKGVADSNYSLGGSTFGQSLTYRLAATPFLLFRPFPWEVHNTQAAIASIEGLGLLFLFWRRRQLLLTSFRSCRENAFVLFLWVYAGEFLLVFGASMTNFGLLSRERVMLTPLAVMIILSHSVPSREPHGIWNVGQASEAVYGWYQRT
jgi:hypothetical protein